MTIAWKSLFRVVSVPAILLTAGFRLMANPPLEEDFPMAIPLLDSCSFPKLADESLSTDSPGTGDDLQNLKVQRYKTLKSKLEELSELLQKQKAASRQTSPHPAPGSGATGNGATAAPAPSPLPSTSSEPGNSIPSLPFHQTTPEPELFPDAGKSTRTTLPGLSSPPRGRHQETVDVRKYAEGIVVESDQPVSSDPLSPQEVIPGQIDRFSLAGSLFGAGDVESCLNVLKQIDVKTLTREDQLWVLYLQAGCHRRAGRLDEARLLYRRVMVAPEADWMKDVSKWWLDHLETKATLLGDTRKLNDTLQAWEAEIDNLAKPPQ